MDDSRLPPGQTLRVTLLTGPLLNALHVTRPSAPGCAACRRPWAAHDSRDPFFDAVCERCGAEFALDCYKRYTAVTSFERWWWAADDEDCEHVHMVFLCPGCRA
jgi:hypothetical protein